MKKAGNDLACADVLTGVDRLDNAAHAMHASASWDEFGALFKSDARGSVVRRWKITHTEEAHGVIVDGHHVIVEHATFHGLPMGDVVEGSR